MYLLFATGAKGPIVALAAAPFICITSRVENLVFFTSSYFDSINHVSNSYRLHGEIT